MSECTPGPWQVGKGDRIETMPNEHGGRTIVVDEHAIGIQANAKLIAAAPQLLHACNAALHALRHFDFHGYVLWNEPPYPQGETVFETLANAIDDATGSKIGDDMVSGKFDFRDSQHREGRLHAALNTAAEACVWMITQLANLPGELSVEAKASLIDMRDRMQRTINRIEALQSTAKPEPARFTLTFKPAEESGEQPTTAHGATIAAAGMNLMELLGRLYPLEPEFSADLFAALAEVTEKYNQDEEPVCHHQHMGDWDNAFELRLDEIPS